MPRIFYKYQKMWYLKSHHNIFLMLIRYNSKIDSLFDFLKIQRMYKYNQYNYITRKNNLY